MMANRSTLDMNLNGLVEDFVMRIVTAVESATTQRIQSAVSAALTSAVGGAGLPRRRGRPPKNAFQGAQLFSTAPAVRRPKQLCPVPGCTNPAAPVFGMVCAKHKDLPKAQIKKYRADRRASKVKGKNGAAARAA
jgi:hypothetical protein